MSADRGSWIQAAAAPVGSATLRGWKESIRDQISSQVEILPEGPVELQMCFRVGTRRNWATLWKPAIDSLGCLLGEDPRRDWHPRDDRIDVLGLHRNIVHERGHQVEIGILARNS